MNSNHNIQKAFHSLVQLDWDIKRLSLVNEFPPCIIIAGLRYLSLVQLMKNCNDYKKIIISLFQLLNIPVDWILEIKNPLHTKNNEGKIPFDVYVYLIDDHVKIKVYKLLLNHIKYTKQTKIHLKIIN